MALNNETIRYIPNNSYKPEYAQKENADKDGYDLVYGEYLYKRHKIKI